MEALLQILAELALQFVFEAVTELGFRGFKLTFGRLHYPLLSATGVLLSGAIAGGISLLLFPHSFIDSPISRLANLIVTPLIAGLAMGLIGKQREKRDQFLVALDRFNYAFAFAFAMALVRLIFTK